MHGFLKLSAFNVEHATLGGTGGALAGAALGGLAGHVFPSLGIENGKVRKKSRALQGLLAGGLFGGGAGVLAGGNGLLASSAVEPETTPPPSAGLYNTLSGYGSSAKEFAKGFGPAYAETAKQGISDFIGSTPAEYFQSSKDMWGPLWDGDVFQAASNAVNTFSSKHDNPEVVPPPSPKQLEVVQRNLQRASQPQPSIPPAKQQAPKPPIPLAEQQAAKQQRLQKMTPIEMAKYREATRMRLQNERWGRSIQQLRSKQQNASNHKPIR
jgi:hypothetical protein